MKIINGQQYSTKEFKEYKLRIILDILTKKLNNLGPYPYEVKLTIYTTETEIEEVKCVLKDLISNKVKSFKVIHIATKEQDDATSKLIEESLKEDW